jgi:hypothetical protein
MPWVNSSNSPRKKQIKPPGLTAGESFVSDGQVAFPRKASRVLLLNFFEHFSAKLSKLNKCVMASGFLFSTLHAKTTGRRND